MVDMPTERPELTELRSTFIARPLQGRQLFSIVERTNYEKGWRKRANFCIPFVLNNTVFPTPVAGPIQFRIPWWYDPSTVFLHVSCQYFARPPLSGVGNVRISAQLNSPTGGAIIDAGCQWDNARGTLKTAEQFDGDAEAERMWGATCTTGWDTDRVIDPLVQDPMPRVLTTANYIGAAGQMEIELVMDFEWVRPVSLSVWEMWVEDL